MYPHDGRVDHLDGGIMSDSKRKSLDCLKAPVRLDDREIDSIHSLVASRSIGQRDAIQVENADVPDCREQSSTGYWIFRVD